jgi:D-hydroxyproline dehydrogenase subunit beta
MRNYDAIIIGSGIIGSFTAYYLAKAGLKLLVVDRNGLAAGTSRASDGNLLISDKNPGLIFDIMRESLRLWHGAVDELGNECEFNVKGATLVTLDPSQTDALREHVVAHRNCGIRAEYHCADLVNIEPELAPAACALGWWPDDAQVQPMLACYSIARHLIKSGAKYQLYDEMIDYEVTPTRVEVRFSSGKTVSARHIVFCTGVWTAGLFAQKGIRFPVIPRKGQICVLERGSVTVNSKIADFAYNQTVEDADPSSSRVQTAAIIEMTQSGTILCGSSREFSGFDARLNRTTLSRIMRDCIALVPALAQLRLIRGYAGLRPFSPDGLPVIGPIDKRARVLVATGHEGTGHGLAPFTGALIAQFLTQDSVNHYAAAFDPQRFPS